MNFDFTLILVLATLATGLGWLLDKLLFAPARQKRAQEAEGGVALPEESKIEQLPWWADFSKSMFPVLAIVLVVRSFLVEPFQIPSGSMLPTLKIGDFILVNKFHYGLRLPVLNTKMVPVNEPQRGDVIVFKYPKDPSINYIKRVVGVPGDRITYRDKEIYVNGQLQTQVLKAKLPPRNPQVLLSEEALGEIHHEIYTDVKGPARNGEWEVPAGQYFVLGDNRDNSKDSRYWGFVSDELLVGKAFAVWMHWPKLFSVPDFTQMRDIQ